MAVLGLVINVLTVIVAGNAGVMFRGKLRTRYQEIIVLACGLVMGVAGLAGGLRSLFSLSDGKLEIAGSVLIVVSLIIGGMLGSSLNPEEWLDRLGRFFRRLTAPSESAAAKRKPVKANAVPAPEAVENGESADGGKKPRRRLEEMPVYNLPSARSGHRFVDGFVIATLFLCLNPFTLTAAQQAGLTGSPTLYYYVSVLDFIVIAALATVYGAGVSFAAAPLLAAEGVTMLLYKLQNLYQTSNFGHSTGRRSGAAESGQRTAGRVLGHHLPDHTGAVLRDRRRYPDCAGSESGVRQKIPGRQSRTRHADSSSVLRGNTACPAGCLSGTPESAEAVRNHTVAPRQTKSRSLPTAESPCFFRAPEERCQPAPLIPELAPRLPVRQITLHLAPEVGGMIAVQEMAQLMHHDVLDERMRPLAQPRIETE